MPTYAAIDVGSNATRFATLTVSEAGVPEPLQLHRFSLRLGADVFAHGALGAEIRQSLQDAFVTMAQAMRDRGVVAYRAVATSAMRDAKNGAEVVQQLKAHSGIDLEIISGTEESRLSRDALVRAMGSVPKGCVIADLGGGSLELDRPGSAHGHSLPLGTVRLLQRFPHLRAPAGPEALTKVRQELLEELKATWPDAAKTTLAVGTGGNLELLSQLVGLGKSAVPGICLAKLPEFVQSVAALPVEARIERYKLRADRADLIVPASLVILALHDLLGLQTCVVPKTGLRDGLLHVLAAGQHVQPPAIASMLAGDAPWQHSARAAFAWLQPLFDKLAPLHGLCPPALLPAQAAHAIWAYVQGHAAGDPQAARARAIEHVQLAAPVQTLCEEILRELLDKPPPGGRANDAARRLAAVVRLACACSEASNGLPDCAINLLDDPVTLTLPHAPALFDADLRALGEAFGRTLVLRDRSY